MKKAVGHCKYRQISVFAGMGVLMLWHIIKDEQFIDTLSSVGPDDLSLSCRYNLPLFRGGQTARRGCRKASAWPGETIVFLQRVI